MELGLTLDSFWKANFLEKSNSADSYRAEQLGVCAIHLVISALTTFCKLENCKTKVWYDNQGTVNMSKRKLRRIRPGSSCADILRNVRSLRNNIGAIIEYGHVDGHMEKYLLWHQMTPEQQMNVVCDGEAKRAVARSINCMFQNDDKQLLPGEDVAVFVRGKKLTSDLSKTIRFEVEREEAEDFLMNECK